MHVFPQLRKLERKYPRELVVLGVHSAKFEAEKSTANIRQAILRYGIEHPVVNDLAFDVWRGYAVRAWPTLEFIDPEGKVIGRHEGEIPFEAFDATIAEMVREFDARGLIDRSPLSFKSEREKERDRPLSFPGKVLADDASGTLFIADSNHNQIVIADKDGRVRHVVGSGQAGLGDGGYGDARFDDPQGMALDGSTLYVADSKTHAIRAVDLSRQEVSTIAGTGEQATAFHQGGVAAGLALNSPWDLVMHQNALYIAMAGFHQLWRMDLGSLVIRPHAGSGGEGISDGPLATAELAQPCGIATDGKVLYFADSETSSVRAAGIEAGLRVETIVGQDLFVFGDVDGPADKARLQHAQGVEYHDGVLFVADTYNNKIKRIDPVRRTATTFLGSGRPGHRDGASDVAELHEPGGVSVGWDRLYVADTNNHAIRVSDLRTRETETLELVWE